MPSLSGEHTNACHTSRFNPSVQAKSNDGFRLSQIVSCQCGPMVVNPSASTNLRPYVCAALAGCLTKKRLASPMRCRQDHAQNSLIGASLKPRDCCASIGTACGPPLSG